MKFCFSTKNVPTQSFLELCNITAQYNFSGFEVFDVFAQKQIHSDSIFISANTTSAKRKLINRHLSISTLKMPEAITENTNPEDIEKYVEYSALVGASVTLELDCDNYNALKKILKNAIKKAENLEVMILIETCGQYSAPTRF